RHLFTHTTGLDGHGHWGGIHNAWLDNVIALTLEKLPIGKVHQYNGMGYDLAGKVMEIASGKSIQRLVQEQLWLPLEITGSSLTDLGYSAMLNSEDIAKMGQLILNQGSYGNRVLFSPETCRRILPTDLSQFYPEVDVEWGIGLAYRRKEKDPNSNAAPYVLTGNLVGHGSASGCIFLADLEHDLVISQARRTGGIKHDVYYRKLLETVEDILK
ncbi:serine hydrolase, partial [bacterium]|nr:serine hydrolase [bacterium]